MRNLTSLVSHVLRVGIAAGAVLATPAAAVPVTGSFTAQIIRVDGDDVAASPFFPDQALLTGTFGYDTDAAVDANPDPDRGLYTFDDTGRGAAPEPARHVWCSAVTESGPRSCIAWIRCSSAIAKRRAAPGRQLPCYQQKGAHRGLRPGRRPS